MSAPRAFHAHVWSQCPASVSRGGAAFQRAIPRSLESRAVAELVACMLTEGPAGLPRSSVSTGVVFTPAHIAYAWQAALDVRKVDFRFSRYRKEVADFYGRDSAGGWHFWEVDYGSSRASAELSSLMCYLHSTNRGHPRASATLHRFAGHNPSASPSIVSVEGSQIPSLILRIQRAKASTKLQADEAIPGDWCRFCGAVKTCDQHARWSSHAH